MVIALSALRIEQAHAARLKIQRNYSGGKYPTRSITNDIYTHDTGS